jgi:radical SAM protein with 4Fe4S-binding SPASM domain
MKYNFLEKDFLFNYEKFLSYTDLSVPFFVDISPSGLCNLHCRWCIGVNKKISSCFLDRDKMFDIIENSKKMKIPCIVFDGFYGDPLLNVNTMDAIKLAIDYDFSVGLGTNGLLLDSSMMNTLVNLTYIRISLDSHKNEKYNLLKNTNGQNVDNIVKSVCELVQLKKKLNKKIRIGFSFMLQEETIDDIEDMILFSKEIGVDLVQFKIDLCNNILNMSDIKKRIDYCKKYADNNFVVFSDIFNTDDRHKKCFVPYVIYVIGPDGNAYTCCECSDRLNRSYGNIYNESFSDIWFGQKKKNIVDAIDGTLCEVCSRHNWRINNFFNDKLFV